MSEQEELASNKFINHLPKKIDRSKLIYHIGKWRKLLQNLEQYTALVFFIINQKNIRLSL